MSDAIDLFTPIARATDPETSHEAAKRIEPTRGTHASQILAVFRAYRDGLTANEIETYTKIRGAWKRVSDLKHAGLIRGTGAVRDGGEIYVAVGP